MELVSYRIDIAAEVDGGQVNFEYRVNSNSAMSAFAGGVREFEEMHGGGDDPEENIDNGVVTRIVATLSIDEAPAEVHEIGIVVEDAVPGT